MKFPAFEAIALKNIQSTFEVLDLPIAEVSPNPNQPRKHFDDSALAELANSIKQYGVVQPIIVKRISNHHYQIIAGERRWRASKIACQPTIPAIVQNKDEEENVAVAIIENVQREQLNPIELAEALQQLNIQYGFSHEVIGQMVGKNRSTISNLLRLLNLVPEVRELVISGDIEMGHARVLLSLIPDQQLEIAQHVIDRQLSVRETEALVKKNKTVKVRKQVDYSEETEYWVYELSQIMSAQVKVKINADGEGHFLIPFSSPEEVNGLIDKFTKMKNGKFKIES